MEAEEDKASKSDEYRGKFVKKCFLEMLECVTTVDI